MHHGSLTNKSYSILQRRKTKSNTLISKTVYMEKGKKANWQTLWDDILVQYDGDEKSAHFMGTIVSIPARSVPVGVNKFLIIDGQQRLTTISIILCSIRDLIGDTTTSERIHEVYLINKFRGPEDTLKFVPTQVDRSCYNSIVIDREKTDQYSNIMDAYYFFSDKIKNSIDNNGEKVICSKILTTIEHSLQVVMINLGDEDDPYLIFESLNFKGEPLTQADLVRNYLLMRFKHSISAGGEQERIYSQYWSPMESRLGDNITEFLRHYSMQSGENVYQRGIYSAVKSNLKGLASPAQVEEEIDRMNLFAQMYASILTPTLESELPIRRRLRNIKDLDVSTSYPLVLRLLSARLCGAVSVAELERCLSLIESFVVRRAVCGVPTNSLNKMFLGWAGKFPSSEHYNWLLSSMSAGASGRRFPTDQEFSELFTRQPQYGRGSTRFI